MEKNRAIFLDRDGTINHDYGYLSDPENFELIHGVKAALRLLLEVGFKLFVVSNQSGVGRGLINPKKLELITEKMLNELAKGEIHIQEIKYCIHTPDENCECRKPSPLMVKELVKKHKIDVSKSYFIGDKTTDVETAKRAGCKSVLLLKEDDIVIDDDEEWVDPDFISENICHAVEWILKDSGSLKILKEAIMKGL